MISYLTDILTLVKRLTPDKLRSPHMIAWLYSLLKPLEYLVDRFAALRQETYTCVQHNGQVIYLEHALIEKFDLYTLIPSPGLIFITDGEFFADVYVYFQAESIDTPFIYSRGETIPQDTFLSNSSEYSATANFIINVPTAAFGVDFNVMEALVKKLKVAGKTHSYSYY